MTRLFLCYNVVMDINIDLSRIQIPEIILMTIVGVLLLFLGYRIKKFGFFIIWFLIGFNLMGILMPMINKVAPEAVVTSELWQNLLPIAGGLLLAMLGFTIEKICVGGIVFGLTLMITSQYFGTDIQTLAIGGIIGIVLAGAAVMLMKPAIIIASSLMGGYVLTLAVFMWFTGIDRAVFYFPLLIGISAIGIVTQFITTRRIE